MRVIFITLLFMGTAFAQTADQVPIPLDLEAQIKIIPPLCENAIYSNRRLFADFCADVIAKLKLAQEKNIQDKAKEADKK